MRSINLSSNAKKEIEMSDQPTRGDMRKWAMLGGLGFGLAMLGRRRKWRRLMYTQMAGHRFGGGYGPWSRFGGYGPWAPGGPQQGVQLPPFIEATLKAWHDRAHGAVPPAGGAAEHGDTAQV
jgi:hypothetical protein